MTSVAEVLEEAAGSIGAKRVYGEPYEKNGVTVIPAARIAGGAGGGAGPVAATTDEGDEAAPEGRAATPAGVGFGLMGSPVGAYVIKGESVRWVPAVDVNRVLLGFQIVTIVFFLVVRSVIKARLAASVSAAREAAKG